MQSPLGSEEQMDQIEQGLEALIEELQKLIDERK
jgi:hypothetical protein